MGKSRLAKKVDKLEKEADKLRARAEKKGKLAQSTVADRITELSTDPQEEKGGRKGVLALLLAGGFGAAVAMKKKRDQELDEALWEEPRSI